MSLHIDARARDMTLTKESLFLIAICTIDLVSTLLLLNTETASEGNPLMAFYLNYGVGTFVLVKVSLIFLPIFIAEWSKQYRPRFVRFMLRATIATYLGVYLVLFLAINLGTVLADNHVHTNTHSPHTAVAKR